MVAIEKAIPENLRKALGGFFVKLTWFRLVV